MKVINATMFKGNPYHGLIYSALEGRYQAEKGNVRTALAALESGRSNLLHVHWEENPLRKCNSETEARLVTDALIAGLEAFKAKDGRLVWTLHNRLPHELEFVDELLRLRTHLAQQADRIIVHSSAGFQALAEQVPVRASSIALIPHPSYKGMYPEPETAPERADDQLLFFGLLRAYKGLDLLIEALDLPSRNSRPHVRVRGDVIPRDPYVETVRQYGERSDIDLHIGRVEDCDVAPLFCGARAAVIPYERFLTSGVALLALTFGTPLVAPDTPQMRELLPAENHPLLFEQGSAAALRDAIDTVLGYSSAETAAIATANRARADDLHPHAISEMLGRVYQAVLQAPEAIQ